MSSLNKKVRFNEDNIFYSPKSTPSPTLSDSSLPSSGGPTTPPQNILQLPGGPVAIHPLLAYHPYYPPLVYDVTQHPRELAPNMQASPLSLPAHVLEEAATQPAIHTITLLIDHFPWKLVVPPTKHYVSIRDLVDALYCFLRHPVLPAEYNTLPTQALKDEVSLAFHSRCGRALTKEAAEEQYQKGVKRVDFLRGRTRFMGLSSTKFGPDVWTLNLA